MKKTFWKKRSICAVMAMLIAVLCIVCFVACNRVYIGGGNGENDGDGKIDGPHEHGFGDYVYNGDATCTKDGTETGTCKYCDETDTRTKPYSATGVHTFTDYVPNDDATCTKDGTETGKCKYCDAIDIRTIANTATGVHNYVDYVCTTCGGYTDDAPVTTGLAFDEVEVSKGVVGYAVVHIGTATDVDIMIPEKYNGRRVIGIWLSAFSGCTDIKSVTIPNSVIIIGGDAFSGCTGLEGITIPDGVTEIGENAFSGCSGLESIEIPSSVTEIGGGAFSGCTGLTSLTVKIANKKYRSQDNCIIERETKTLVAGCNSSIIPTDGSVTRIGRSAFAYYSGLTSIEIPNGVTHIGENAFDCCSDLESITIPDSVTYIGRSAFRSCSSLTSITLPNDLFSIEGFVFAYCSGLTSIEIPNGVRNIGFDAFRDCSGLTSLTLPNSLTSIDYGAFAACSSLTSIALPDSVNNIDSSAFRGCTGLTSLTVDSGNQTYRSQNNCIIERGTQTLILGCNGSSIPDDGSVTSIGESAFCECSGLTDVTIPDSVTGIGAYAFSCCYGLTSIVIPIGVTSIGNSAFDGCNSLTVYCEAEIKPSGWDDDWDRNTDNHSFGYMLTTHCSTVWDYEHNDKDQDGNVYVVSDGVRYVIKASNGTKESDKVAFVAKQPASLIGHVVISSKIKYDDVDYYVSEIEEFAFCHCSEMTSIELPNSIVSIGRYAFADCVSLTSIEIPSRVTSIGEYVFVRCGSLTELTVDYFNSKYHSSGNCIIETATKTLVFGCKNSYIPTDGSVTTIGKGAFAGCNGLTSITIPFRIGIIEQYAFAYCYDLTSVKIINGVYRIDERAFTRCVNLTGVEIPRSVVSIGSSAFAECYSLKSAIFENTDGWRYSNYYTEASGVPIPSSDLADASTAANYLTEQYCGSTWKKS